MAHMSPPFPAPPTTGEVFDGLVSADPATPLRGLSCNVQSPGPGLHAAGNGAPGFDDCFHVNEQGELEVHISHHNPPRPEAPPIGYVGVYESKVVGAARRWAASQVVAMRWEARPDGGHVAICTLHPTARWCGGGARAGAWGPVSVNDMLAVQAVRAVTDPAGGITLSPTGNWYMNGRNRRGYIVAALPAAPAP